MKELKIAKYPDQMFVMNDDAKLLLYALADWAGEHNEKDSNFLKFIADKFFYDAEKLNNDLPSFNKVEKFLRITRECPLDLGENLMGKDGEKIPIERGVKIQ